MLFSYKAVKADGSIDEGTREAPNKEELARLLTSSGLSPLHIGTPKRKFNVDISLFERISTEDKITFAKNLSVMLKAGLPLSRALSVIVRETNNRKMKKIVETIIDDINRGQSFTDALKAHSKIFPIIFISIVRAGEGSGKLVDALATVAFQLGRSDSVAKKVRGAMLYPAVILILMIAVGVVMMIYVVPELVSTFNQVNGSLPFETQIIIDISNAFTRYGLLIFIGLAIFVFLVLSFKKTKAGRRTFDWLWLHIPFVKLIVMESASARTARTLGSLLSAGVDMIEALKITEDVAGNVYFKDVIREAEESIGKGQNLSKILLAHQHIYPPYLGETAAVGEETGDLATMLLSVAESYEEDVSDKMKNISTIIEPVLMVVIGLAVGFFAIAVITPMYSLVNNF